MEDKNKLDIEDLIDIVKIDIDILRQRVNEKKDILDNLLLIKEIESE